MCACVSICAYLFYLPACVWLSVCVWRIELNLKNQTELCDTPDRNLSLCTPEAQKTSSQHAGLFCAQTTQCSYCAPFISPRSDRSLAGSRLWECEDTQIQTHAHPNSRSYVLRVITHAWSLNGNICYHHNNTSRGTKSFIAPSALPISPLLTQIHTHASHTLEPTGHPPVNKSKEGAPRHKQPQNTSLLKPQTFIKH